MTLVPLKLLYRGKRERFIFYDTHIVKVFLESVNVLCFPPGQIETIFQARFSIYRHFIITQHTLATRLLEVIRFCGENQLKHNEE